MAKTKRSIDMLHGPLNGKLLLFALPIAASSMLQQLFNSADTAVVGRFADANALAAVGTNGEIVGLLVSLSLGLSMGANVLLAGLIGRGEHKPMRSAIHTAVLFALLFGVFGLAVGQVISRPLLELIDTPADIIDLAVLYLKLYFLGYPALLLYDFGSAILRSKGDSRRPFLILLLSGVVNVLLNLFLVVVCRMGVAGVAIATDAATLFSALAVLVLLLREEDDFRLELQLLRLHKLPLVRILQIGIPAALQGAVFCLANIFVQAAVNSFGSITTAGSSISVNFEYFGYYMITAYGQAATTFTSQNFGAGNIPRCKSVMRRCILWSIAFSAVICVPLVAFRPFAASWFSTDAGVIEAASLRILVVLTLMPMCGLYEVPAGFLRGIGHSASPAMLMVLGTCALRIFWVEIVFPRFHQLGVLYLTFPISWILTTVLIWGAYFYITRKEFKMEN